MDKAKVKQMIIDEFKEQGLDIAEDVAIRVVKVIFGILPKIAAETDTMVDDMFIPVLSIIEPKIIEMLDQIDGEEN